MIFVNCNWVVIPWQQQSTHLHTNSTENDTNNNRTTRITTNLEEGGPCHVFASFTLAFDLQLRKKHGKTSVRVRKISVRVQYTYYQNTHTLQNLHTHRHTHTHTYAYTLQTHTHTHTHAHTNTYAYTLQTHTHTHTHTLQNNIKPPQYKLKQTQCKIYPNEIVII